MNHFVKFLHLESSSFKLDFDYHYNHVLIWIMIAMISIVSANYIRLAVSNDQKYEFSRQKNQSSGFLYFGREKSCRFLPLNFRLKSSKSKT